MDWQAENLFFIAFVANSEQQRCDEVYRRVFEADFEEVTNEPGPVPGKRASGFLGATRQSVITRPGRIDLVFDAPRNDPPMLDNPITVLRGYLPKAQSFFGELTPNRVSCVANLVKKTASEGDALSLFYEATEIPPITNASELHFRYNQVQSVNNYRSNFIFDHSVLQMQFFEFQLAGGQPVGSADPKKSVFFLKKALDFNCAPTSEIPAEDVVILLETFVKKIEDESNGE